MLGAIERVNLLLELLTIETFVHARGPKF